MGRKSIILDDEKKKMIKRMNDEGYTISQIYRALNLPYSVVYYYIKYHDWGTDENKKNPNYEDERTMYPKILHKYLEGDYIGENCEYENNVYIQILKTLYKYRYGITAKKILKKIELGKGLENFTSKKIAKFLQKLRKDNFVEKEEKWYYITDKGKEIIEYLFSEN